VLIMDEADMTPEEWEELYKHPHVEINPKDMPVVLFVGSGNSLPSSAEESEEEEDEE
jgi:hypothetical protein